MVGDRLGDEGGCEGFGVAVGPVMDIPVVGVAVEDLPQAANASGAPVSRLRPRNSRLSIPYPHEVTTIEEVSKITLILTRERRPFPIGMNQRIRLYFSVLPDFTPTNPHVV